MPQPMKQRMEYYFAAGRLRFPKLLIFGRALCTSSYALVVLAPNIVVWPLAWSKSSTMTLLPEVGYRAETPRAMSGSERCWRSWAFRDSTLTAFLLFLPFDLRCTGASGSSSSSESLISVLCRVCNFDKGKGRTHMLGSISRSIASAASFSQLRS